MPSSGVFIYYNSVNLFLLADETQQRITILPWKRLTKENKAILKQHFKDLVQVGISLKLLHKDTTIKNYI
jgi:hypothetical protein